MFSKKSCDSTHSVLSDDLNKISFLGFFTPSNVLLILTLSVHLDDGKSPLAESV